MKKTKVTNYNELIECIKENKMLIGIGRYIGLFFSDKLNILGTNKSNDCYFYVYHKAIKDNLKYDLCQNDCLYELYDLLTYLGIHSIVYLYELDNIDINFYLHNFKDFDIYLTNEYNIIIDFNKNKIFNLTFENVEKVLKDILKDNNIHSYNEKELKEIANNLDYEYIQKWISKYC